jgi:hypothetical protein
MADNDLTISEATYQGYTVHGLSLDRKPGVTSDGGFVEVDLEDVKQILVRDDFRLWQAAELKEAAGPFPMQVQKQLARPTVTDSLPPSAKGFKRGGTLIMKTTTKGAPLDPVILSPMFLAPSGIEETEEDLESAIEHREGRLRVNLVDFRHFWQENGTPVFGRYNLLRANGKFDEETLGPGGEPWSASDVFDYVTYCLPGSPAIDKASDVFDETNFPPPVDVDMKLELPVEWLKRLLDTYALECHLTHNSQILLKKRGTKHQVRKFRRSPGAAPAPLPAVILPDNPPEEKKTIFILDRPEAVMIVGERRQRRVTATCVACFIDEDQKARKMQDLPTLWGYSLEEAQVQSLLRSEKAYDDIEGKDANQKFARIRIARKYFFKLYVPEMFFTRPPAPPGFGPLQQQAPAEFWPDEKDTHPFLPMKDPWWVPKELKDIGAVPRPGDPGPGVNRDDDALVETDIIVRANIIDQRHVTDVEAVKELVNSFLERHEKVKQELQRERDAKKKRLEDLVQHKKPNEFRYLGPLEEVGVTLGEGLDVAVAAVQTLFGVENILQKEARLRSGLETDKLVMDFEIRELDEKILAVEKDIQKLKANLTAIIRDLEDYGFARLWVNVPWGVVDDARFTVQKERGFVIFNEVVGVMEALGTYDKELTKLNSPGHVQVTYMTDVVLGAPEEFTTFTFMANPKPEEANPILVRISNPTVLKPAVVRDEDLAIYEDEFANPMNIKSVATKAASLARAALDLPRQQVGYSYLYPGFHRVVTDESVNSVAWQFDGDVGTTKIIANNPDIDSGIAALSRKKRAEDLIYGKKRQK